MSLPEAKLDKFSAAVLKDAEEHRSKILAEIEEYRKSQMDKAEEQILHEAYVMIQNEIASIRNDHTREISRAELEGRRDLLIYRENLTKKVFDEAAEDILKFAGSDKYEGFLTDLVKKAIENLPEGDIVIEVRKDDLTLGDKLAAASGRSAKIAENVNIRLGGFIITDTSDGVVIDETLDTKLKEQNDWFSAESGLSLDM